MDVRVLLCFLAVGCAVIHRAVSIQCPTAPGGWTEIALRCFLIVEFDKNGDRLNRDDAESWCQSKGGHLASIHNEQQQNDLYGNIQTGRDYWIGLNDEVTENTFVWIDGSAVDATYWNTNAQPAEPDTGNGEDCVNIEKSEGKPRPTTNLRSWGTRHCNVKMNFICSYGPCDSNPCQNGGECILKDMSSSGFECDCPNGYNGRLCEIADEPFTCADWDSYSDQYFADAAYAGIIGENGRKCRISKGSASTACNWYVKYDIDGDASDDWLGLTYGGGPGGTGCCASPSDCITQTGAGAWLKLKHKDYCCGAHPIRFNCNSWDTYSNAQIGAMAYAGNIGSYARKCRILRGDCDTACNWYVKYDTDGDLYDDWKGLKWDGTPGGTGCCGTIPDCNTLEGAGAWLKAMHKEICCPPMMYP